jgi:hypothetical protein
MPNDRDFLGRGLRFPVSVNLNGGVSSSQLEENVRQCIFIILGTAPVSGCGDPASAVRSTT